MSDVGPYPGGLILRHGHSLGRVGDRAKLYARCGTIEAARRSRM